MAKKVVIERAALVLQGGGTRGAFTAGVLDMFMERGVSFGYVIGTSAGALHAINYLSGDIGRGKRVTTEGMLDPKFFSIRNRIFHGSAFDFRYLFHTLPKTKLPFNATAYNASPCRFFCCATSIETGKAAYFEKGVCKEFYKALAASSSLPLLSRPVRVEGHKYLDGGVVAPVPYQKPLEDGYEKLVMVMTRPEGFRHKKAGFWTKVIRWFLYHRNHEFYESTKKSNEYYDENYIAAEKLEKEGKAFVIYAPEGIHVGRIEKNRDSLEALYQAGREAAETKLDAMLDFAEAKHE